MKNKILIKLIVPSLMDEFEIFIPVNEKVFRIKKLITNCLYDLTDGEFDNKNSHSLINPINGLIYKNNDIIKDLDIRNSNIIILY